MRRFLLFAALALVASSAHAQSKISSFSAASAQTGTEQIPEVQSGANVNTTPAQLTSYINLHALIPLASGVSGNLPLANMATIASPTFLGNISGSTAAPLALNPLAVTNSMNAVVNVGYASTVNIATLSGAQIVDGATVIVGETVLLTAQTTASQNGIWLVNSGAWTRPATFPSGFQILQHCDYSVTVKLGTSHVGTTFYLSTTSAVTIDTTAQSWNDQLIATAGSGVPAAAGDCTSWANTTGAQLSDNTFACAFSDLSTHVMGDANIPAVTGTGCSLVSGSSDQSGEITGTGADTCTLTFGGHFDIVPFCAIGNIGPTVIAYLSAAPTIAAAIFKTTAAGSFQYWCAAPRG